MTARAGLAVISFAQDAGGVGYVARLLRRALRDAAGEPWTAALDPARYFDVSLRESGTFALRLLRACATRRVDWLLFNHVGVARALKAVPAPFRVPYAVFVHDIEAWSPDLDPARKRALAGASLRIANSAYTAARIEATHPELAPVVPCPLGLLEDTPAPGAIDETLLAAMGRHAVLIVGRISSTERYKGHDELLAAWPTVVAAVPAARLVIAGRGDDVPRLSAKAVALGVGDSVLFPGYVNEATLALAFERAALYAMPSAREGFGLVYLEAMRAGIPCIGSTTDAARDVIVDGRTGFLVDRADPGAVAAASVALLTNDDLRGRMGRAGRARFESGFTYEHFRDRLLPILSRSFPGSVARRERPGAANALPQALAAGTDIDQIP